MAKKVKNLLESLMVGALINEAIGTVTASWFKYAEVMLNFPLRGSTPITRNWKIMLIMRARKLPMTIILTRSFLFLLQ